MKAPQLKYVSTSQPKPAPFNPARRVKEDRSGGIRKLAKNIQEIGLQYPILITEDNIIIDGHRRWAAHKLMGLDTIPCIVSLHANPNAVYAGVNSTSKNMTGNDAMAVYLKEPEAVSARTRSRFDEMIEVLGRPLVETICKHGLSINIYRAAKKVCVACDRADDETIRATVKWFMTCESFGYVRGLIETKVVSPMAILRAVKANRPLRVKIG